MTRYAYKAKKGPGKIVEGVIEAETRDKAIAQLIEKGFVPIQVKEEVKGRSKQKIKKHSSFKFSRTVRSADISVFTQQLTSLVKSKVSLLEAIGILLRQTENKYMRNVLSDVYGELKDGRSLSDALGKYPEYFSPLYINMVRAGEFGGVLENSLARLDKFREEEEEMRSTVAAALAYPIFIVVVGILTIIILITFAVPRLTVLFEESGQALPFVTRTLISVGTTMRDYWYLPVLILTGMFFILKRRGISDKEKVTLDRIKLKIPVFGEMIRKASLARFSRSFGVLLGASIPVLQAIRIAILTLENVIFRRALEKVEKSVIDGASLAKSIESSRYFPPFMVNMVAVGEKGGNLENALLEVAHSYEREVRKMIKIVTSLLEPAIILVMGLIVGVIVFGMLLPIFEINLAVR